MNEISPKMCRVKERNPNKIENRAGRTSGPEMPLPEW